MSDLWSDNEGRPSNAPSGDFRRAPSPPPIVRSGSVGAEQGHRVRRWATRTGELFGGQPAAPAPAQVRTTVTDQANGRYVIVLAALLGCAVIGFVAYVLAGSDQTDSANDEAGTTVAGPGTDADVDVGLSGGSDNQALDVVGSTGEIQIEPVESDAVGSAAPAIDQAVPTSAELASATVQLLGLDDNDRPVCGGSGIVVEPNGLILTNAHVVQADESCAISSVGVAVTGSVDSPPELQFRAEILVVDEVLDLAVLRIAEPFDGEPSIPDLFVTAPLGDSDSVELGDEIRILGYPIIGGDTITSTSGTVSGFTSQVGIGSRAIIKTDAAISAGNSGGMAVDSEGRVIGVSSRARASETAPPLDCRAISDTNEDGTVNDDDVCIPVGGFLNGIRPVNLARPILEQARALLGESEPVADEAATVAAARLGDLVISNPRFSDGQTDNEPVDVARSFVDGVTSLCLFVDWDGMPENVMWDAVWEFNGSPIPQLGHYEEVWEHGGAGRNFWICAEDADGHDAGVYEVGLFIDGNLAFAEGVVVAPRALANHEVTWVNNSDRVVCQLAVNPLSRSGQVGVNELAEGQRIGAGASLTITLPEGLYAVEARDCDGTVLADHPDGGVQVPDPSRTGADSVTYVLTPRS